MLLLYSVSQMGAFVLVLSIVTRITLSFTLTPTAGAPDMVSTRTCGDNMSLFEVFSSTSAEMKAMFGKSREFWMVVGILSTVEGLMMKVQVR